MKGDVFNLFEAFIVEKFNRETFESILAAVRPRLGTKGPFVGPRTYPDSDFMTIVAHAVEVAELPFHAAVKSFGRFCFPYLFSKLPPGTANFKNARELLWAVDSAIHVEVKKVTPGADLPKFVCRDVGPDQLIMIYRSKRRLYDFAEGLIEACCEHFNTSATITKEIREAPDYGECEFKICFKGE